MTYGVRIQGCLVWDLQLHGERRECGALSMWYQGRKRQVTFIHCVSSGGDLVFGHENGMLYGMREVLLSFFVHCFLVWFVCGERQWFGFPRSKVGMLGLACYEGKTSKITTMSTTEMSLSIR